LTCFGWECFGEQAETGAIAAAVAAATQVHPAQLIAADNFNQISKLKALG